MSKQNIFISQRKCVFDLLQEISNLGCKSAGVPTKHSQNMSKKRKKNMNIEEESAKVYMVHYQGLVGNSVYST